jgi:hypothetical protein
MTTRALAPARARPAPRDWASPAPVALTLTLGLFHLATLLRFPAPIVDEAYFASHAWGLIHFSIGRRGHSSDFSPSVTT